MGARLWVSAAIVAALAIASPAAADGDEKAIAQDLLVEGNALLRASDFIGALVKYEAAHTVYPSPKLLLNIGTTLRHLGRNAEAARAYERYTAATPEEDHSEIQALLDEIEPLVGRVKIRTSEANATVRLNGRKIDDLDRAFRVDPGSLTIVAELPGRPAAVATIEIEAGEERSIRLEHPELPRLVVEQPVMVTSVAQPIVGYSLLGLGGGGLVIGAVLAGVAAAKDSEAADHCSVETPSLCDPRAAELAAEAQRLGVGSTIALIAGAALAATGGVLLLTVPDTEQAVRFIPLPGVGGRLVLGGVF